MKRSAAPQLRSDELEVRLNAVAKRLSASKPKTDRPYNGYVGPACRGRGRTVLGRGGHGRGQAVWVGISANKVTVTPNDTKRGGRFPTASSSDSAC